MSTYRPQQSTGHPIFLITFTVLALVYSFWMIYSYVELEAAINWYGIVFVLGTVVFFWYSRIARAFYVTVDDSFIEWRMKRGEPVRVEAKEVNLVSEHSFTIDFLRGEEWVELNVESFGRSGGKAQLIEEVKEWCKRHSITFEEITQS